jgi:hypothetical protein
MILQVLTRLILAIVVGLALAAVLQKCLLDDDETSVGAARLRQLVDHPKREP